MKACAIQTPFCTEFDQSEAYFGKLMDYMDACDESMDLIVLPEYSNVPCSARTREEAEEAFARFGERLMEKAKETAVRCGAVVCVCGLAQYPQGLRNTITVLDRNGRNVGQYDKQHLVPFESGIYKLDASYTADAEPPLVLTIDGVRYAFLICYDCYFYEMLSQIGRFDPDILVIASYQRSDTHAALEIMNRFAAYNTNAYVVRASVALREKSLTGGCSMIVAPNGDILMNMVNAQGLGTAEFDPAKHYLKPAGFGRKMMRHHQYVEEGRQPWKYRPAGPALCLPDDRMPYPRICAHRGFNTVAPENSLPAYGAAIALGAQEIEFDLWAAKDGVIVSTHDPGLERTSDGTGFVWEYTYEELLRFDFGSKKDPAYAGLRIMTFEEVLRKFACHAVMNIHIKTRDNVTPLPEETLREIIRLIDKYDCRRWCYFMSGNVAVHEQLREMATDIARCAGAAAEWPADDLVAKALRLGCKKIQLFKPHFKNYPADYLETVVPYAHENGLRVNIFWSDDPAETRRYLDLGIDTVLTNDYLRNALV